jgi:hypothetical protein
MTNEIQDADIISETKNDNGDSDLLSALDRETVHKEPGVSTSTKTETTSYWNSTPDDFDTPAKTVESKETKETEKESKTESKEVNTGNPGDKKITDRAKLGSARTAVGMVELTQGMLLKPWINHKFKKKFSPEDITRLSDKVAEADLDELDKADQKLRKKWDKLMTKRDKLMNAVPLKPDETKDLTEAFYNYFDITGKNMPPEWYLAFALINVTGNRVIDIAFD